MESNLDGLYVRYALHYSAKANQCLSDKPPEFASIHELLERVNNSYKYTFYICFRLVNNYSNITNERH